jgi:hypothetical protein
MVSCLWKETIFFFFSKNSFPANEDSILASVSFLLTSFEFYSSKPSSSLRPVLPLDFKEEILSKFSIFTLLIDILEELGEDTEETAEDDF